MSSSLTIGPKRKRLPDNLGAVLEFTRGEEEGRRVLAIAPNARGKLKTDARWISHGDG